jgi:hypothetical protein
MPNAPMVTKEYFVVGAHIALTIRLMQGHLTINALNVNHSGAK